MKRSICALAAVLVFNFIAFGSEFYAAPNVISGDGSLAKPFDLHTALAGPKTVKPGDTIWLRGGTYSMKYPAEFTSGLNGTAAAPIIVRRYMGEAPVMDLGSMASAFYVNGSNAWFWGMEITASGIPRLTSVPGPWSELDATIEIHGLGVKFINCFIHDVSQGFSFWHDSIGSEVYGNIVYHAGWQGPDRGHGHAIYSQNEAVTGIARKSIAENFMGESYDIGLQLYGSGAAVIQDYQITGNVLWDNGIPTGQNVGQITIAGGGSSKRNIELDSNYVFNSANTGYSQIGWGWDGTNRDVNIHNNWFIGGGSMLEIWKWDVASFHNNYVCNDSIGGGNRQLFLGLYSITQQTLANYTWDQNKYCSGPIFYDLTGWDVNSNPTMLSGSNGSVSDWRAKTGFDTNSSFGNTRPTTGADVIIRPNRYEQGRANIIVFNWGKALSATADLSTSGLVDGDQFVIRDVQNYAGPIVASGVYSPSKPTVAIPMAGLVKAQVIGGAGGHLNHTAPAFGTFVLLGGKALSGGGAVATVVPPVLPPVVPPVLPPVVVPPVVVPASGAAAFVRQDNATSGSWKGVYGSDGQVISNSSSNLPAYATASFNNASLYTWVADTPDVRALQKSGPGTDRVASTNYQATGFSIDINLTDMGTHTVALYLLDWDHNTRAERIDITDTAGNLLDSRTAATFDSGTYLVWNLKGHVIVKVTKISMGSNAVISGVFFGDAGTPAVPPILVPPVIPPVVLPPGVRGTSAAFVSFDTVTKGSWKGAYGLDGAMIANDASQVLPSYADLRLLDGNAYTWAASTLEVRALQNTGARAAAAWFATGSFSFDVELRDGNDHQVALYLLDWDQNGRSERIDILDAATGKVLDTRNASGFTQGEYLVYKVSGHVTIRITSTTSGANGVLSGVFFR